MSFIALWLAFPELFPYQQVMDRLSSSMSPVSSIDDYSGHNIWNPLFELLFLEHVNGIVVSYFCGPQLGQDRTLVTLLSIYSVTRRRCSSLHGDSLGTTVHGVSIWYALLSPLIRLHATKVFVRDWEMVPKIYRFQ